MPSLCPLRDFQRWAYILISFIYIKFIYLSLTYLHLSIIYLNFLIKGAGTHLGPALTVGQLIKKLPGKEYIKNETYIL